MNNVKTTKSWWRFDYHLVNCIIYIDRWNIFVSSFLARRISSDSLSPARIATSARPLWVLKTQINYRKYQIFIYLYRRDVKKPHFKRLQGRIQCWYIPVINTNRLMIYTYNKKKINQSKDRITTPFKQFIVSQIVLSINWKMHFQDTYDIASFNFFKVSNFLDWNYPPIP